MSLLGAGTGQERSWSNSPRHCPASASSCWSLSFPRLAHWSAKGLTAYDAAYVALAEQTGARLVTDDAEIVPTAPDLAIALTAAERGL